MNQQRWRKQLDDWDRYIDLKWKANPSDAHMDLFMQARSEVIKELVTLQLEEFNYENSKTPYQA